MKRSLSEFFTYLGNNKNFLGNSQEDLFGFISDSPAPLYQYKQADIDLVFNVCSIGFNCLGLEEPTRRLYEASVNAFDTFVHAWMSELPIEADILSFGRGVIAAAESANGGITAKKRAGEKAASDRGNAETRTTLAAAYKVYHEIHRMMGFLRFSPDKNGVFVARCSPDHLVLPALWEYFTARFGKTTAWTVIDEKRGLYLQRHPGKMVKITVSNDNFTIPGGEENTDEWEDLWRHYHKIINNESRNNPNLQRQFMPKRYWKYLPEVST